jgi:hypothetical protein
LLMAIGYWLLAKRLLLVVPENNTLCWLQLRHSLTACRLALCQ